MRRFTVCIVGAVASLLSGVPLFGETLESVEKAITEKVGAHGSYRGKVVGGQHLENAEMKFDSEIDLTYEGLKKGDQWLYRSEGTTKSVAVVQGQEHKQDTTTLVVFDGQFVWTLTESNGQKSVSKAGPSAQFWVLAGKAYFDNLRRDFELTLLPDETIDGKVTWPIQATARQAPSEGALATLITYFDKETGIGFKSVGKDSAGKIMMNLTTDLTVNTSPAPDRFIFKAPEDVPVMDLTRQQPDEAPDATAE